MLSQTIQSSTSEGQRFFGKSLLALNSGKLSWKQLDYLCVKTNCKYRPCHHCMEGQWSPKPKSSSLLLSSVLLSFLSKSPREVYGHENFWGNFWAQSYTCHVIPGHEAQECAILISGLLWHKWFTDYPEKSCFVITKTSWRCCCKMPMPGSACSVCRKANRLYWGSRRKPVSTKWRA